MKDLKIDLNLKSIMLFEQLTDKSFYSMDGNDFPMLLYAVLIVNNPKYKVTFNEFMTMLKNEKLSKKMVLGIQEDIEFIQNLTLKEDNNNNSEETEEHTPIKMTDIVTELTTSYNLDINYVMYDMQIWEIKPYADAIEKKMKQDMENQRFWSYINILPHIDGKKVGGPEKLIPFPWEKQKENKKKNDEFIKTNTENIVQFFNNQDKEDE